MSRGAKPHQPSTTELFAHHAPRLRALARTLVACDQTAEDLVQEAFVAAVERPPREPSAIANWLAVIVRNLARTRFLRESRRRRHERAAARSEVLHEGGQERFELFGQLVQAVQGLAPLYREAIVLRFFEDLPPREIAARLDLPVATVRTRIRRGLEALRGRLDAAPGGRDAWVSAFLPLAFELPAAAVPGDAAGTVGPGQTNGATSSLGSPLTKPFALAAGLGLALITVLVVAANGGLTPEPTPPQDAESMAQRSDSTRQAAHAAESQALAGESGAGAQRTEVASASTNRIGGRVIASDTQAAARGVKLQIQVFEGVGDPAPLDVLATDVSQASGRAVYETVTESGPDGRFAVNVPIRATTDPAGNEGVLGQTLTGRIRCSVISEEWAHRVVDTNLRHGVEDDMRVLVRQRDTELQGTVTGPDGRPVSGAWIRAGFEKVLARTDSHGVYRLRAVSDRSRVRLIVVAQGFGAYRAEVPTRPASDGVTRHDIRLAANQPLRGRVTGPDGQPILGAIVYTDAFLMSTRTQGDGTFVVDWAPAAGPAAPDVIYARARGYVDGVVQLRGRSPASDLEIRLARATPIRGLVVTPDGSPIAGAAVYLRPGSANNGSADAFTGRDGRFEGCIEPHWRRVTIDAAGFALTHHAFEHDTTRATIDVGQVALATGRSVRGRIVDHRGNALTGVAVFGILHRPIGTPAIPDIGDDVGMLTQTDEDGRFELRNIPGRGLALKFVKRGYLSETLDPVPDEPYLALQQQGTVAGRVVDARTGAPIPEFQIRFRVSERRTPQIRSWFAEWTTGHPFRNADGVWSSEENRFASGHWIAVSASAPGYAPSPLRSVQTKPHPSDGDHVIRLWPGGRVTGRCLDVDGRPAANVHIRLLPKMHERPDPTPIPHEPDTSDPNSLARHDALTNADGSFSFSAVTPGTASLLIDAPGRPRIFIRTVEVPREGDASPIVVTLEPGTRLEGHVLGAARASGNALVVAIPLAPRPGQRHRVEGRIQRDGRYHIDGLPGGAYRVGLELRSAGAEPMMLWSREMRAASGGGTLVRDLELVAGNGVLEGTLADMQNRTDSVRVTLEGPTGAQRTAARRAHLVDPGEETFRFEGLSPGTYQLSIDGVPTRTVEVHGDRVTRIPEVRDRR